MAANSVALILGFGPGIGTSVAKKFASIGYKVAVVSRSGRGGEGYLSLKTDFYKPDSIPKLFEDVKKEFNAAPSVVVYNASVRTSPPDKDSIFSTPADALVADMNVNAISPYVAAQLAVKGWETLPKDTKKTFIYTGNFLNEVVLASSAFMTQGMGKSAAAYWIGNADLLYSAQGLRFHYADERFGDGKAKYAAIDGDAHAEFYAQLAAHEGDVPWLATFVKEKGYVGFKL